MGLAADVGTLARLPKVIGSASLVSELALTARTMGAAEALACGLGEGICQTGVRRCMNGRWADTCEGEVMPSDERESGQAEGGAEEGGGEGGER